MDLDAANPVLTERVADAGAEAFSARQAEVLECALRLLVEGGDRALTTARVAQEANCSKQSLYKWFGDRDGILAAVIGFQARKVRVAAPQSGRRNRADFEADLLIFARDLVDVLAGDASLALNRLAIGQASQNKASLGRLVLERGRRTIEMRARTLLEAGCAAGHIETDDPAEAYAVLYGLIVGDLHVRLLLGDSLDGDDSHRQARAERAIHRFFRLFGTDEKQAVTKTGRP